MPITRESIFAFLRDEFDIDTVGIDADAPLISSGIVDSLGVMHFVEFISQAAGIKIDSTEVRIKNLDTVNLVLQFAAQKRAKTASQ
jgi:acyl carrier protein